MSLLTKIQTLLSTWFPNKVQDKVNFDKWTNQMVTYDDGVLRISDAFHTNNILKWDTITSGNDSFKISSYEINSKNYSVEFKLNTLGVQIAVGDETGWVFACNIGTGSNVLYTHNSNGGVQSDSNVFNNASISDLWRVEVKGSVILIYKNDILVLTKTDRKTNDYPLNIRIYTASDADKIEYLRVQPLKTQSYTESEIIQKWQAYTDVSGRTIYKLPLGCNQTDTITLEFKFQSISSSSVLGIDLNNGANYNHKIGVVEEGTTLKSYYSSSSNDRNKYGTTTTSSANSIYKIVLVDGNKGIWYKDNVQFAEYNIELNSTSNLRYDLFNTNSNHLEYLKVTYGD